MAADAVRPRRLLHRRRRARRLIDGSRSGPGDAIVGLASSGLHANGYSLVRALVAQWDLDLAEPYQARLRRTLGDAATERLLAADRSRRWPRSAKCCSPRPGSTPGRSAPARALEAAGHDLHGLAHITGGGLPGNVPRALPRASAPGSIRRRWPMPSVMHLFGALGGLEDAELRATFNGGIGMVVVVARDAVDAGDRGPRRTRIPAWAWAKSSAADVGGRRYVEGQTPVTLPGRIAVGVSGAGTNLRALVAAAERGELGGGSSSCLPTGPARRSTGPPSRGLDTALVPGGDGRRASADGAAPAARPDVVVLAGYLRIVGPPDAGGVRRAGSSTSIRRCCRRSRARHPVRDALAHGVAVSGATVHLVDATLDGGPIVAQEAVPVLPGDDEAGLHERDPGRRAPAAAARRGTGPGRSAARAGGRPPGRPRCGAGRNRVPTPRRALLSVSDKTGLVDLARGLVGLGFELVSTGGTARPPCARPAWR